MNKNTLKAILLMLYGIENFYDALKLMGIFINSKATILNCTVGDLMFLLHQIISFFLAVPPSIQLYTYRHSIIREYLTNYSGDI